MIPLFIGLALLLLGAAYHRLASARETRQYPPPGRLVDVGRCRLHCYEMGAGSPTVVFESGLGGTSLDWSWVQPEIARFTHTIAYDRAGYGWSESGPLPRTSQQMVMELRALLQGAGVQPPYVLVGHSLGGLNVRLYAKQHADEVVGVVLVDALHEDVYDRLPPALHAIQVATLRIARIAALFGLLRLLVWAGLIPIRRVAGRLPPASQPQALAAFYRLSVPRALCGEVYALPRSMDQVRAAGNLGNLPLFVLSSGSAPRSMSAGSGRKIWRELQYRLPGISSSSTHVVAAEAGHLIHFDHPGPVIEAVERMVGITRRSLVARRAAVHSIRAGDDADTG
jgi:pimeloyl-ACP methyl ester carboxylesterase